MSAPVAAFSGTPLTGAAPVTVTFTDASTNTPTSWAWDFGDGGTSSAQDPVHVYLLPGTYSVGLTATNVDGHGHEIATDYLAFTAGATSPLALCMEGIAALLTGITANAFGWPVESVTPPAIVVGYPSLVEFDMAMGDGGDRFVIPTWWIAGKSSTADTRNALGVMLSGVGSVKATLDGLQTFGDVRVIDAEVAEISVAGVGYMGIRFDVEVYV